MKPSVPSGIYKDISAKLKKTNSTLPYIKSPLRLVILGHVDHGKSTLVGRLLYETGSLPDGKLEAVEASCKKRGQPFEWAFVTDALQAERDQNVTIETSHIWLRGKTRDIVIIDVPGHREFLKNMVTGAGAADAALLLVDAKEGISQQTRSHAKLLQCLGIQHIIIAINKMDTVGYKQSTFKKLEKDCRAYLKMLGMTPRSVVPVSARQGDNVSKRSKAMPWYKGKSLLALLAAVSAPNKSSSLPLRFLVQDVYKQNVKRIIAGRVESGVLTVGNTLLFSPAGVKAKVRSIEGWPKSLKKAIAGQSIGITLDNPIFVERGQVASHEKRAPLVTNLFDAQIFWLGKLPLENGTVLTLKIGTQETSVEIRSQKTVAYGSIAQVALRTRGQVAVDADALGRFALVQDGEIRGGGRVIISSAHDRRVPSAAKSKNIATEAFGITHAMRAQKNNHKGGVIWLTGLPASGKSTIARLAQKKLFDMGCQVFVLDGDNIRQGLSRDLGFSVADRSENIRRVAEAAALFSDAGMIVITSFISPYEKDRELACAARPDDFHCVYIKASVTTCKKRDPKGHYKKAKAGKIPQFTGVSAPYEEPRLPDLVLDTETQNAEACANQLVAYIKKHLVQ
jgi:bifunctional enzyme CysN/CysC